jgi:predicted RecB family endonuclease
MRGSSSLAMDAQYEELAERIAQSVTVAVTRDVTEAVTKNVVATVTHDVTQALNEAITVQLTAAERRLSSQAQAHMEAVRAEARMAAEGYAATLDGINRRLDTIEETVTANHRDTTAILRDHNKRLTALESSRTPSA